jgi:hypothetical protein
VGHVRRIMRKKVVGLVMRKEGYGEGWSWVATQEVNMIL